MHEKVTSVDCLTDDCVMKDNNMDMVIMIRCKDAEDMKRMVQSIHDQLRGNQDYIDSNIVLDYEEETITIKKDGKDVPSTNYRIIIGYFNDAKAPVEFTIDPNILRKKEG